jgi:hypothetical protein
MALVGQVCIEGNCSKVVLIAIEKRQADQKRNETVTAGVIASAESGQVRIFRFFAETGS